MIAQPHPLPWTTEYLRRLLVYTDRGRDFARGRLDCWGFVMLVLREQFGMELPSFLELYETVEEREQLASACAEGRGRFAQVAAPRSGDIALLRIIESPTHTAVVCGPNTVIELARRGVGIRSIAPGTPYGRRLEGVYRWAA